MKWLVVALACLICTASMVHVGCAGGNDNVVDTEWNADNEGYYRQVIGCFFTSNTSYFTYKNDEVYAEEWTIKNESQPMIYSDKQEFFWNTKVLKERNVFQICQYRVGEKDFELKNTYFSNGTQIKFLFYGCPFLSLCEGIKCSRPAHVYMLLVLALMLFIVLLFVIIHTAISRRRSKDNEKRTVYARTDLAEGVVLVQRASNGATVVTLQLNEE